MDYTQLKKDVKVLLKENRSDIRKEMWKILSIYWIYSIAYAAVIYFTLSKDISSTQPSNYVISYLLGFIRTPLMFVFNVCLFRALYFCLPGESFPGFKATGSFLNATIIVRCILLGLMQQVLGIASTLSNLIQITQPKSDAPIKLLGYLSLIQLLVNVFSIIFFSVFLPCFIAQGISILESFKLSFRLVLRFSSFIRFSLRVILPTAILITPVILLCLTPLFFFKDYLGKLYFMEILGVLFTILVNTIIYGLWMKATYICLCIMEYVDIDQCVLQLSEDIVEEHTDEDIEQRTENLESLLQIRGNMKRPAIAAGKSVCVGLKNDGIVSAFDMIHRKEYILNKWIDIRKVASGGNKIYGIRGDGTVIGTDTDHIETFNELKDEAKDEESVWHDIVEIGAGEEHIAALKTNGEVIATGDNKYDQCEVNRWKNIDKIAVGSWHTVGLKKDGTVVAEGLNEDGQCNVAKWTDIYSVAAGDWHTVGLKTYGKVVAAGFNENDQCNVSKWADIAAVACGKNFTLGLMIDGTVISTNNSCEGQCNVSGWTDIVAIFAGDDVAAGLKSDGTVVFTKIECTKDIGFPNWTDIQVSN